MSYEQYRPAGFSVFPPVIKNLMIINGLFFLAVITFKNLDLVHLLGLHALESKLFKPYQLITHFFLHADPAHLLSNLFMLWMFGATLENYWGGKKFLTYYTMTGFGAAILFIAVNEFQIYNLVSKLPPENVQLVLNEGSNLFSQGMNYTDNSMGKLNGMINAPALGASGAVFGVLLAFGMTFPDALIFNIIKAKYLVVIYGLIELSHGLQNNPGDNVAHFAHLGGMIFGHFLIRHWNKNRFRHN